MKRSCSHVKSRSPCFRNEDLREQFARYGEMRDIYIPKDYYTGNPRGFAYVQFLSLEDAKDAIRKEDGAVVEGRTLQVTWAQGDRKTGSQMAARDSRGPPSRYALRCVLAPRRSPRRLTCLIALCCGLLARTPCAGCLRRATATTGTTGTTIATGTIGESASAATIGINTMTGVGTTGAAATTVGGMMTIVTCGVGALGSAARTTETATSTIGDETTGATMTSATSATIEGVMTTTN